MEERRGDQVEADLAAMRIMVGLLFRASPDAMAALRQMAERIDDITLASNYTEDQRGQIASRFDEMLRHAAP